MYASYRHALFDGSSAQSSDYTSDDYCVADFRQITLSFTTIAGAAASFTVQGSDDEGFRAAIANRSTITTVTAAGLYTVDPGMRWLRVLRPSSESLSIVQIHGRT